MTIAEEILRQLGGRKFVVCTGCSNFHSDGEQDYLGVSIVTETQAITITDTSRLETDGRMRKIQN